MLTRAPIIREKGKRKRGDFNAVYGRNRKHGGLARMSTLRKTRDSRIMEYILKKIR